LLRDMAVTRPNQVLAMDITYIPMARGFVYRVTKTIVRRRVHGQRSDRLPPLC
jgi:transposase InsO family protein